MTAGDDIYGSAEHLAFRETVRKFVQSELVPRAREFDHLGRIDKTVYPKMGALGLLGIRWDPQYGGQGLDYSYHAVFLEELALCDNAGVAMGISVQTDMATPALARFGSDALKRKYLTPAIRGEHVGAIAVTEPGAGSDVAAIKTRAVRKGDEWVINGSKMFITNAATADWLCLLAVTDPEAGYGGFSQIIVPTDRPGLTYQTLDISMAKVFCTAVEQFVANTCVQLFGGAGYCWENPAARAFVDSRLVSIGGGADEVMKQVVAKILQV